MKPIFTSGELEVMQVLWEHGELNPGELQKMFPRPIQNAALRFQLKLLLEKNHVGRRKKGKAYYYHAVTTRDSSLKKMAKRMSEVFCQGSAKGLIAELVATEKLSNKEIEELKQFVRSRSSSKKGKRKGGKKS